ncbi:MAG: class I SAM-dependent methyltransferase [Bacteriovorax sp.]|nr:class I SAM-dependent methyltransferase [Bacteriovorax sp.]
MSHFNQIANTWDTPEKIKLNQQYAEGIKKHLTKKDAIKILEVGCGTGLLGSQFVHGASQLTGVDTSPGMLEVFNQKFYDNKNVHSRLLNLEEQEFDEDGFDLIISSMAFHHLKEPAKMILKLKKLLSPDGILAIIDLDAEDGSFHPDPKQMGVHHFGFAKETIQSWSSAAQFKKSSREIINVIKKEQGEYPVFLAVFFN